MFVQLFVHAYWTSYRHQRSPKQQPYTEVLSKPSSQELQVVTPPEQLAHDQSHQAPLNGVFDLEAKRRPFWYSIG